MATGALSKSLCESGIKAVGVQFTPTACVLGFLKENFMSYGIGNATVSIPRSFMGHYPGVTGTTSGTMRTYPGIVGTMTKLTVWASTPVPTDTAVSIRLNGVVVASATILAGQTSGVSGVLNTAQVATDYLTNDLVSSGAQDVGFRVDYVS